MINVQETNYKTHIFGDFVTFTPIVERTLLNPGNKKSLKKLKKCTAAIYTLHILVHSKILSPVLWSRSREKEAAPTPAQALALTCV